MKEERFEKVVENNLEFIISCISIILIIGLNILIWIAKFKFIGWTIGYADFFEIMWSLSFLLLLPLIYWIIVSYKKIRIYWRRIK